MNKNYPLAPQQGEPLATPYFDWYLWREVATEDSTTTVDLTADGTNLYLSNIVVSPETAGATDGVVDLQQVFGRACNGVEVRFFGDHSSNAENDTFDFEIFGFKEGSAGSPGVQICSATDAILGTALCDLHPTTGEATTAGTWCDTIAITDYWPSGVGVSNSGNNGIAALSFDTRGYRYLYIQVSGCLGGTTAGEAHEVGAIITGY